MHRFALPLVASILTLACSPRPPVVPPSEPSAPIAKPSEPTVDVGALAPELADARGTFEPRITRSATDPRLLLVTIEWTGAEPLELTRGRASSHCGVADWRVTLIGEDGTTYLSTPLTPQRLCYQVIVFERTYRFEPGQPLQVAGFHTQHLIPRDGAGPFQPGRYRVLVTGTFGSAAFTQAEGEVTL